MDIPCVHGSILTHQNDVFDEAQSAFFTEWDVPLECAEADDEVAEMMNTAQKSDPPV